MIYKMELPKYNLDPHAWLVTDLIQSEMDEGKKFYSAVIENGMSDLLDQYWQIVLSQKNLVA